jgi:hypothetical protein
MSTLTDSLLDFFAEDQTEEIKTPYQQHLDYVEQVRKVQQER